MSAPAASATSLTRRRFGVGVGVSGAAAICGGAGTTSAAGLMGPAATFIGETLGKFASEVSAQALARTLAATFSDTHREMSAAGHEPQMVRGWHSDRPNCVSPVLTLASTDDCMGIVTQTRAGCSGVCVSLPLETRAWASCVHPRMGLPGYAARCGQPFTTEHVVRYFTPIVVERRRNGRCGGTASIFITQQCIVVEIEPYGDFARVAIGNPKTGRSFRNERLPLIASDEGKAADWAVV
jgi:hypothetical protein